MPIEQVNKQTNERKINYIELPAADFAAVEAFYGTVFGWTFTSYGEEYHAFNDGQMDGGFYRTDVKSTTLNGGALVIFYSAELEKVRDDVVANGGEIVADIFTFPGGRRFQFADPHGNELAVWSDK